MHTAIAWFTRNPVAANLLMAVLCVGGFLSILTVNQEEFPSFDIPVVTITVPYLGAAPEEVEQGVCIRIEEAIESVAGIDNIRSVATEGSCLVNAELEIDTDDVVALNEIKGRVDAINSFPVETENPTVSMMALQRNVLYAALSGDADERILKEVAQQLRDELTAIDGVSQVSVAYIRPYEISIEVPEYTLRRHGLTFEAITHAVRNSSLDMPGGSIKARDGEILLRSKGQAYWGEEFAGVVVLTRPDGTNVTLGEIADIRDGFEEGDLFARFNGKPAVVLKVSQLDTEDIMQIAGDVKGYIAAVRPTLPEGLELTVWTDASLELEERMSVLNTTALGGLALVLIVLALFLKFRLAMWVAAGIPIALLGTIAVFPYVDFQISTLTVLAFILVLGVLVDDAIVVGERVYSHEQVGKSPVNAAIDGTREVSIPVIFGVLTTMAAFHADRDRRGPHDQLLRRHRQGRDAGPGFQHHRIAAYPAGPSRAPPAGRLPGRLRARLEPPAGQAGGLARAHGFGLLRAIRCPRHRQALHHCRRRPSAYSSWPLPSWPAAAWFSAFSLPWRATGFTPRWKCPKAYPWM